MCVCVCVCVCVCACVCGSANYRDILISQKDPKMYSSMTLSILHYSFEHSLLLYITLYYISVGFYFKIISV